MGRNLETCCRSFALAVPPNATERSSSCTLLQCHKLSSHIDLSMCVCCCCYYYLLHWKFCIWGRLLPFAVCHWHRNAAHWHFPQEYNTFTARPHSACNVCVCIWTIALVWSGVRPARTYAGQKRCPSALKSFNLSGH